MDTGPTIETQLLAHAERQTKALEAIDISLKWLFGLVLIAAVAWLIVVTNS